jgi:hypothetical protein
MSILNRYPRFYGLSAGTALAASLLVATNARSEDLVTVDRIDSADATPGFEFHQVPRPSRNDAAAKATFQIVDGRVDSNSGGLATLNDGKLPTEEDQPQANFFFAAGTRGGRLSADLGASAELREVNTYSWHPAERAPQVYRLYASDGQAALFNPAPKAGTDPETCGWKLLAKVDTRVGQANPDQGGQNGVRIAAPGDKNLGAFRYVLFDIAPTTDAGAFGQTFYSEIDLVTAQGPAPEPIPAPTPGEGQEILALDNGTKITIDTSETPGLREWTHQTLAPVVREWYPKLVQLLPSEGFTAPKKVTIAFKAGMSGVADTSGTYVRCAAPWFQANLKGEAVGSIVHELTHVVQQYGRVRRQAGAERNPGWLVEGLTDYIRWYHYEPQSKGAEIGRRQLERARYDGSYRVTGNFLNWVIEHHDRDLIQKLNTAMREGRYREKLWQDITGQSVQDLGAAWKKDLEKKLGPAGETK